MTPEEMRDILEQAREHLSEAINHLKTYVRETGDRNAEAYLVDQLAVHLAGHGFLSRDLTIDDLIRRLNEAEDEEE
jgi:hypothetical protein